MARRQRFNYRIGLPTLADLIGLLADPNESRRDDVPPLRPALVAKASIFELEFRTQVVLR
jgi:hypothetical protein